MTLTFQSNQCGDTLTIPQPDNIMLLHDYIVAHGLTHGEDWRTRANKTIIQTVYTLERQQLLKDIINGN